MSSTPYDIPGLLQQINNTGKHLGKGNEEPGDSVWLLPARCALLWRRLLSRLSDTIGRRYVLPCFATTHFHVLIYPVDTKQPGHHSALRVCLGLKMFDNMAERSGVAKSSSELANMTGADPVLTSESPKTVHRI